MPVSEETLAHGLCVGVRHLAAQKAHGEGRHRGNKLSALTLEPRAAVSRCTQNVRRPAVELEPRDGDPACSARRLGREIAGRHREPSRHPAKKLLDHCQLDIRHDDVDGGKLVDEHVRA